MNITPPNHQAIDSAARAAGAAAAGAVAAALGPGAVAVAKLAAKAAAEAALAPPTDQAPELGQASKALAELSLVDDPQSASEIIHDAMSELNHIGFSPFSGPSPFGEPGAAPKTFAERESAMQQQIKSKLNEKTFTGKEGSFAYKFSAAELQQEIAKLKQEVQSITQQRQMGMTDCWGSLTNRQIACQSAIKAIEACLKERSQPDSTQGPEICPTLPKPFLKI